MKSLHACPSIVEIEKLTCQDKVIWEPKAGWPKLVTVVFHEGVDEVIRGFVQKFFEAHEELIPFYCDASCLPKVCKWNKRLDSEIFDFCIRQLSTKSSDLEEFTEKDLAILGYSLKDLAIINRCIVSGDPITLKTLTCYGYALLRRGERGVRELLFNPTLSEEMLLKTLMRWGYRNVSEPSPGDLVVYLDKGLPQHMGVYKGEGIVHSKWGSIQTFALDHGLEFVPEFYGLEIAYYRKVEGGEYDESYCPKL